MDYDLNSASNNKISVKNNTVTALHVESDYNGEIMDNIVESSADIGYISNFSIVNNYGASQCRSWSGQRV